MTKKFLAALDTGDPDTIRSALNAAVREIDKAVSKGVIKRNNASRRISKLMKKAHQALHGASPQQPSA